MVHACTPSYTRFLQTANAVLHGKRRALATQTAIACVRARLIAHCCDTAWQTPARPNTTLQTLGRV
eukprot:8407217-Lingulodinium_polyedra.AAC.1